MKLFTKTKRWVLAAAMVLGMSSVGSAQNYFEDFESATTGTSYTNTYTPTLNDGIVWQLYGATMPSTMVASSDKYNDSRAIRTSSKVGQTPVIEMTSYYSEGADSVSFYYARYGSDALDAGMYIRVSYNTASMGSTWTQVGADITGLSGASGLTKFKAYVGVSDPIRFKIEIPGTTHPLSGGNSRRMNIDDFLIEDYVPQTCFPATNVQVVDNLNGSINLSWGPASTAPAVGYSYAVVPTGTPLTTSPLPNFGLTTVASPINNIAAETSTGNPALVIGNTYDVYVISVCDLPVPFGAGLDTVTVKQTITLAAPPVCNPVTALDTLNADYVNNTIEATFTSTATNFEVVLVDLDNNTTDTSFVTASPALIAGLVSGTNYEISVRAICGAGDTSVVTTSADFLFQAPVIPCAPVTALDTANADLVNGTIDVVFTSAATAFEVVLVNTTTSVADTASLPATSPVSFTGLIGGNSYTVNVRAICGAGDTSVVTSSSFLFQAPPCAIPTGVDTANADFTNGTIDVVFTSSAPEVEVVLIDVANATNDTLVVTASPASFTGLVSGTNYDVVVRAICAAGDTSVATAPFSFLFQAPAIPCAPVTGLDTTNTDLGVGAIDILYTTTAPEVLVIIYDNTTNTVVDSIVDANPPYIQGLTLGNNYTISVYAICGAGDTSATAATVTFDFGTAPCDAVTALTLTDNEDGSIDVSWTAPTTAPANGYIYAIVATGATPAAADYVASSTTTLTGLTATTTTPAVTFVDGDEYDVFVIALCSATDSSAVVSETVEVTIDNTPATCDPVTNLAAVDNTDGSITISWTAPTVVPGAGYGYAVLPTGVTPSPADYVVTTNTSVLNITETTQATPATLVKNTTYNVYVISMCSHNPPSYSTTVNESVTITNIGVEENAISLTVYPNPVAENVYINATNVDVTSATISVLDMTGKVLTVARMVAELTEINMSNFASGVYFVKVQSGVNTKVMKVVKN